MRYRSWVVPVLLLLLWTTAASAQTPKAPAALRLTRITPDGDDVPVGRQIVLEFNRAVVPVGRMERRPEEIPLTITPPLACAWRWLTTTTLACQPGEKDAFQLATRYTLTIHPGITTQDGAMLQAAVTHTFRTQRPQITNSWFKTWQGPGKPEVLVVFDQPVSRASVEQHLYIQTEHKQRVALSASVAEEYKERGWLVQPVTDLPLHTAVELRVEPGIVSTQGPEPGGEQRAVVTFDTFPALRFLGVTCTTNAEESVIVYPGLPRAVQPRCNPLGEAGLLFSAPVLKDTIKNALQITPNLDSGRPDDDPWEEANSYSRLDAPYKKGTAYPVWLPSPLKAYATYRLAAAAQQIKDEFGRTLDEAIAMQFVTAHRPPHYVFNHEFSVLEHNVDTHVPIMVTNLASLHLKYDTLTTQGRQAQRDHHEALYAVEDIAYAYPLKMRELIPATSGAIQGTLRTTPEVDAEPQWFFSQVTPFHVHVKLGHYNTLVWVTRFDTGLPVNGVQVQITKEPLGTFAERPPVLAEAATNADGIAMLEGTHTLDPELALVERWERDGEPILFVRLRQGDDMALVPLTYAFWVRAAGTNQRYLGESLQKRYGHLRTWGTTPQGVYRAGDTVDYKLYVRDQDNQRLVQAPRTGYTLKIIDPMDKVVHEVTDVQLSAFGAYHGTFTVPETGAVGWYRFTLAATFSEDTWEPLRVLISDFTPAPFRVSTDLNGTLFSAGAPVTVLTQAKLHAGGPYGAAKTRLTVAVQSQPLVPDDPQAAGFFFAVRDEATTEDVPEWEVVHETETVLDDKGALETTFALPEAKVVYGQLQVESAVQDDRGKSVAGRTTAQYVGRDRYVGVNQADWVLQAGTPAQIQALVVNEYGKMVEGTEITVKVAQLQTHAAQVKDAGNTYVTRYEHTWVDVSSCTLVAALTPGECTFTPPGPGTYRFTASIMDTQGRTHSSSLRRWVTGAGEVLWEMPHGYGLPIFPEKVAYRVGETARYLVQNPFPGAQALITVERFGVQQSWRETFRDSTAMVEFPITPDHLPGFYLSVLVMSPRVDKPLDANQVDLGKPAFRMGYVQVPVRDPYKELRVDVRPAQEVYKPRQKATVDLYVRTRQGELPAAPVELAVAVLDEAVFDLIAAGRDYFDPYKGFYTLDTLDMRNYSLLVQLIGRQKFEKKGANPGGGGGLDLNLRSLFKFVSYWNPSLTPDATGQAQITFDLPDNVTGWRVLAMAVTPEEQMGLGEGHFKANKPTEVRPALPNQVTAGDRFEASFTVMNRTETPRTLEVALNATGPLTASDGVRQTLQAEPYKRYLIRLPLQTTAAGTITLQARAGDSQDQDGLEVPLPVHWSQKLEVAATYGTSTADTVSEAMAFPPDIRSDVGHVSVVVSPTVIGSLEGAFAYMRDYPYLCWEQVLTKGVMASHYRTLKPYLPASLQWSESDSLPQHTLDRAANYQAPNGGMTYFIPQEQYVSPALSAYTALAFNWLRSSGHTIPAPVESKLHDYLLTMLRQDIMPDFYSRGMSSTVRAMALAALAPHTRITRADVQRYQPHVREMSLFGQAHYLLALTQVADTAPIQNTVVTQIRAHGNETGGKLVFSETLDSAYQRILESPMRTNCAILSALLAYEAAQKKADQARDAPFKLTQTITQTRKHRHRWENTQENMFCMQALIDFSRAYERTTPDLTLQAALDTAPMGSATFRAFTDPAVDLQRPIQASDLGHTATMTLSRQGQGRFYYATRLFYSPATLRTEPINSGIEVHREYSVERKGTWELLHSPMEIKTGELVKVDLYLSLPAARNFVVVDDPVPGGLEPVNRDLATASTVDADKANVPYAGGAFWFRYNDWAEFGATRWSFYHRELRHHVARFYSEYLAAGRYHLSYVAQAIAPGEFTVLPGHAEEMYNPDTFGQGVPATLRIISAGQVAAQP